MSIYADYIYKTPDDKIRVRVFRKCGGRWDFDVYSKTENKISTFSILAGDDFKTKAQALKEARSIYKNLKSISVKEKWTN